MVLLDVFFLPRVILLFINASNGYNSGFCIDGNRRIKPNIAEEIELSSSVSLNKSPSVLLCRK